MKQRGLYRPEYEHDACGVGFVANLNNKPSHQIVRMGIEVLRNLEHRGACGCDPETGDGAGILLQIPDPFFRKVCRPLAIHLPPYREYGVGFFFMPRAEEEIQACMRVIEEAIREEEQVCLGWRDVPVDNTAIGSLARESEPQFRQVFIARGENIINTDDFERTLFVIRKSLDRKVHKLKLEGGKYFYPVSFSCQRIIYKGLLLAQQLEGFYPDLSDPEMASALALVHQRYSTNTFPTWDLAQPFRYMAHNGEINTVRGNCNWMNARESLFESGMIQHIDQLYPVIPAGQSDSACLDNALEMVYQTGRSLPHAVSMLIPEAWQNHESMPQSKKDYYEYHSCLMEPWDGPASIAFTNGRVIGAVLDRNGLRPSRYWVTRDDLVIMASETGVLNIPDDQVKLKGRLQPGRMFLCDLEEHRIVSDDEIKETLAKRSPYGQWLNQRMVRLVNLPAGPSGNGGDDVSDHDRLLRQQQVFGYTLEDLRFLMKPMAITGHEEVGSMGNDAALAVLSEKPRLLFDYFKQLFAQVTNPPLDAIREEMITSLITNLGCEGNLFEETPEQGEMLRLEQPILTCCEMDKLNCLNQGRLRSCVLNTLFERSAGPEGLEKALDRLCLEATGAVAEGKTLIILSDRGVNEQLVPIPSLLAVAGVHHHLIREGTRTRCGIILESGEPRECHHFALLSGFGCGAVNPYVALATLEQMRLEGQLDRDDQRPDRETVEQNYIHAIGLGLLKIMSKMGISTLHSYRGAQIFEAIGLNTRVIDRYFTSTASRIEGIGIEGIAREALMRHKTSYPERVIRRNLYLDAGGQYQWRRNGERHMINPFSVSKLQEATRVNRAETFEEFSRMVNEDSRMRCTLRGLMKFRTGTNGNRPIPDDQVEPATEIVKRFKTGAMSLGSISQEAHETLAIAMNRLGGKSNTGEGGEDSVRFTPDANGDDRCSAIKQVASGRFGVTIHYLVNSKEIQIKMAQGAKPGEGGALSGLKVDRYIGRIRHSTPGVGLISPPPHHDIYSIEDLAQLIHDLKNANPSSRINVKLVAEVGVGTVAAGVAKGKADVVLISGHDGGTGNSPLTSIKHAGIPWELGLAETHQTLLKNDLRSRIIVETDGQLKTGRDVAIAILLGAEEFGFSTAPLITLGCIMMRKCHLNTCPVGIATQDPMLRKKFEGKPEHVINYFFFVAEELRQIMAQLGFRTVNEMVGRVDRLDVSGAVGSWKSQGLDLSPLLMKPEVPAGWGTYCREDQDHGLDTALDNRLIELAEPAIESGGREKVRIELPIRNINRTVGTMLSGEITRRHGGAMLPPDSIHIRFRGSAGQSLGCFLAGGVTIEILGDANDYFGKGLSGGHLVIRPPKQSQFKAEENIIIGNVAFYGATSGEAYIRGIAGERFCVRNSGAEVVVEGVGDHGCEYMTGGCTIILGETGRNFAAGMSGGVAWVLDPDRTFAGRCNTELVDLEEFDQDDDDYVRGIIERHLEYTGSEPAARLLENWETSRKQFVKVFPRDYRRALEEMKINHG
jgi:glutamate synthase domain-containing protein 2/glutamate synthase domain-containing protein 1/glutamate synthase domain-containing protein 3